MTIRIGTRLNTASGAYEMFDPSNAAPPSATKPADPAAARSSLAYIDSRLAFLGERLGEVRYDEKSGEPKPVRTPQERRKLEAEITSLGVARAQQLRVIEEAEQAAQAREAQRAADLQASIERTERINRRAIELVEEHEAKELAERLAKERAAKRGF